jgi:regulator of protease activity HflC (stomatin/prohibitin superfamily)
MKTVLKTSGLFFAIFSLMGCAIVREGEVGVKRTLGKYSNEPYTEGLKVYNPLLSSIVKVPTQTKNLEVSLNLPSKEGLNIAAEISILYNVVGTEAPNLLRNVGMFYEENVILPVFRSSIADVSARFYAKDMHTGQRSDIELAIQEKMSGLLQDKGISIEAVLFKSIQLPRNLARAIEEKLQAEQKALRMVFVLREASSEAEKKRIDAAGVRDAQNIISEGLTPQILQYKSIEAFMELSKSPNTKIIVSDGDMPNLMLAVGADGESGVSTGN